MHLKYKEKTKNVEGIWTITVRDLDGKIVSQTIIRNIIPTVSREQYVKALAQDLSDIAEMEITHQELGTGTTTPANGDTGLETPTGGTTRKFITSSAASSNQLNVTAFWAAGEATGTHEEFALFINGTGVSNSGILFNRVLLGGIVVDVSNSLSIDGTVTVT